jgi:aquaporin Z
MFESPRSHWPEYLMEAGGLGLFMLSAGLVTTLLEYPGSPVMVARPAPPLSQ